MLTSDRICCAFQDAACLGDGSMLVFQHPVKATDCFFQPTAGGGSIRSGKARRCTRRAEPAGAPAERAGAADQLADFFLPAGRAVKVGFSVAGEHQLFEAVAACFALVFVNRHCILLKTSCPHRDQKPCQEKTPARECDSTRAGAPRDLGREEWR